MKKFPGPSWRSVRWLACLVLFTLLPAAAANAQLLSAEDPPAAVELVYAQPFTLQKAYASSYRQDSPRVAAGYLIVVAVDHALTPPRQGHAPILFAGEWPVEVINTGEISGRWIGVVPRAAGGGDGLEASLAESPLFVSNPEMLPEALSPARARTELARALQTGVTAAGELPSPAVRGRALRLANRYRLQLRVADLIERFAGDEVDVVSGLRAPLVERRGPRPRQPPEPQSLPLAGDADLELDALPALTLGTVLKAELAGRPLAGFPFFEFVRTFNEGSLIHLAIDPGQNPDLVGQTGHGYVVASKSRHEWQTDPALTDLTGGVETITITAGTIQANTFVLDSGTLNGDAGTVVGVGYDLVLDLDQDGELSTGDVIDGFTSKAGLYVVKDLTIPGPLAVTEALYTGGTFLGQNTFYPTTIDELGELPLVVVSHGNGHNYQWYDHIGFHLASYGYVVMSHQNNTSPGIEAASTTTLTNTDYLLANLDVIEGGSLAGHIDTRRIVWLGHSRGGEGIARAYDRIFDGDWEPAEYTLGDLELLSSIAPTDFLSTDNSDPHAANYHLWVGGADADVSGCASSDIAQSFHLLDRAQSTRQSISLHGVGHGDFHNGGGSSVATGPCLVGRSNTHTIMRGYLLPLLAFHVDGEPAGEDFLWRQWENLQPIGAPTTSCAVVDLYYRARGAANLRILDDFQTEPATDTSSSGGAVTFTVTELTEGRFDDGTGNFTDDPADPMNGMTLAAGSDTTSGIVFTHQGGNQTLEFELPAGSRNLSSYQYFSLRGAQVTRHPNTTAALGDQLFVVALKDGSGNEAEIAISAYGGGLEEPYQRGSCGSGTGWNNDFETIRLGLRDFVNNGSDLDLTDIQAVELRFGPSHGSAEGRIGLDELEFVGGASSIFLDGFETGDTSAWDQVVP